MLSVTVLALIKSAPAVLASLGAGLAFLWVRKKAEAAGQKAEANVMAKAIVENHAVEEKESHAVTDQEADDALDAAARADRT